MRIRNRARRFAAGVGIALLAACASAAHAKRKKEAGSAAALCEANNLTVEMPQELRRLRVAGNSFVARDNSAGVLTLENNFGANIVAIAAHWEYDDAKGAPQATMESATGTSETDPQWLNARIAKVSDFVSRGARAIMPGAKFTLGGTSPITMAACPAEIRVTRASILLANHKEIERSAARWAAGPQFISYAPEPGPMRMQAPASSLPWKMRVRAQVKADGSVSGVQCLSPGNSRICDALGKAILRWDFAPATRDGHPVAGEIVLLVRAHERGVPVSSEAMRVNSADAPEPLAAVDLFPLKVAGEWEVAYAGALVGLPR